MTHVFDNIFDTKSNISPWWLDFQKKYSIHEKCGRASPIRNILAKVMKMKSSLPKSAKTIQKLYNLFTVEFAKELTGHTFQCFSVWRSSQFSKWRISTSGNLSSKIFLVSDHQILYSKLYKNHCREILTLLSTKLEKTLTEISWNPLSLSHPIP